MRARSTSLDSIFDLTGRVAVISGGAGMLGFRHAEAINTFGGIPVIADVDEARAKRTARKVGRRAWPVAMDVTKPASVSAARDRVLERFGKVDILINNAARDPKVERDALGRLEDVDLELWNADLAVGLTGSMLCSRYFGEEMAKAGKGVILNIASDLALIAPDQRLYRRKGVAPERQRKKPASYSVVKAGMLGLTRYLATYWADQGVRVNALCPGGIGDNVAPEFAKRISQLIPMARMARGGEYRGAIVFLVSDASSYVTGTVLVADGGRTCW